MPLPVVPVAAAAAGAVYGGLRWLVIAGVGGLAYYVYRDATDRTANVLLAAGLVGAVFIVHQSGAAGAVAKSLKG